MKECPICHELNEDNQDTCKKCHASLDFKVYRADEKELNMKECPNCPTDKSKNYHCNHCGCSTEKIVNGLCTDCNRAKKTLKIILYISVAVIYGFVNTLLRENGIFLGAIPTMLIFGVLLFLANFIPNRIYDNWK